MGFVKLEEITNTYPELSIPFVGFYGDWNGSDSITPILSFLRNAEEVDETEEDFNIEVSFDWEKVDEDMEVKFFAHIEKEDRVHIKEFKGTIKKD